MVVPALLARGNDVSFFSSNVGAAGGEQGGDGSVLFLQKHLLDDEDDEDEDSSIFRGRAEHETENSD